MGCLAALIERCNQGHSHLVKAWIAATLRNLVFQSDQGHGQHEQSDDRGDEKNGVGEKGAPPVGKGVLRIELVGKPPHDESPPLGPDAAV